MVLAQQERGWWKLCHIEEYISLLNGDACTNVKVIGTIDNDKCFYFIKEDKTSRYFWVISL